MNSGVYPTDELVKINGEVVAIRDDNDFDDLDRILAFDELKQTISEASRPLTLTFVVRRARRAAAMAALLERQAMALEDKGSILALISFEGEKLRHSIDQVGASSQADVTAARYVARAARARAILVRQTYHKQQAPMQTLLEARATDAYVTARRALITNAVNLLLEEAEFDKIAALNMPADLSPTVEDGRSEALFVVKEDDQAGFPVTTLKPSESMYINFSPDRSCDLALEPRSSEPSRSKAVEPASHTDPSGTTRLCKFIVPANKGTVATPLSIPKTIELSDDDDVPSSDSGEHKIMVASKSPGCRKSHVKSRERFRSRQRPPSLVLKARSQQHNGTDDEAASEVTLDHKGSIGVGCDGAKLRRIRATRKFVRDLSIEASVAAMRAELLATQLESYAMYMQSTKTRAVEHRASGFIANKPARRQRHIGRHICAPSL